MKGDIIYYNLKNIGKEFYHDINKDFRKRLNNRKYSLYVDGDFLLLRYMCHRGVLEKILLKNVYSVRLKIMELSILLIIELILKK